MSATDFIREERIGGVSLAIYYASDSMITMHPTYKRPWVVEVTGRRIRRFRTRTAANKAYYAVRDGLKFPG